MSFEFGDDDIDWSAVVQSSDALINNNKSYNRRQQQKQQKLSEFMQSAPFAEDIANETLPDKDLVHREIKKFNHKRHHIEIPLMDEEASKMWVYPSNLEMRRYQFVATKQALFTNQLVCLPTGMGKTLIAAVLMYNFYRWYPSGKIIFACPTRALVEQQMNACHNFLDISQHDYADLTGRTKPIKRIQLWKDRRLFFVSPQTLKSDLARSAVPVNDFVCVVIDEAHKAQGEHSFHTMIRDMMATNSNIRILALSATPGSNQEQIQSLISNLRLSRMIIKYDDDPDIKQYSHETKYEVVKCPLNPSLRQLKDSLLQWINKQLNQLMRFEAIRGFQADTITLFNCSTESNVFAEHKAHKYNTSTRWFCINRFSCLFDLVMLREKLEHYSVNVMLKKLDEITEKVRAKPRGFGVTNALLRDTAFNEWKVLCKEEAKQAHAHPKMRALAKILEEHFTHCTEPNSRVIVFSSLRHSVSDIVDKLKPFAHCKPYHFVGQASGKSGKGLSNKQQQQVIQDFKAGKYNILVSTCVGEEGLDIGQVDIVIHYDIAANVLRNVQRSGRTGRKRNGRVIYLCSTIKEQRRYSKMKATKNTIRKININQYQYFENAPRMFPNGYNPSLHRTKLVPPADFIGLSARKRRKIYQPIAIAKTTGLLSSTQCAAFQHKYDYLENELNHMHEMMDDAIEHCHHTQSEFDLGEIKPSETTKFMVSVFRTIEDEQELELEYQHLFQHRDKNIYGDLDITELNASDEFEDDPYKHNVTLNSSKIRDARPLFSDDDIMNNDLLDAEYGSLMDTNSDDCMIFGIEKKEKKRSSKRKRKKSLNEIMDEETYEIDIEPKKKKRKTSKRKSKKKSHKKKRKKHSKKKQKERETSDSCSEILDLSTVYDPHQVNYIKEDKTQLQMKHRAAFETPFGQNKLCDENADDSVCNVSPIKIDDNVCKNDNEEWNFDEEGFVADDDVLLAMLQLDDDHHKMMKCPKITDNPWNGLKDCEKNQVQMFLDDMMPAPRLEPDQVLKVKNHIEASRELIKFMRIKTCQMDSFRAMKHFWPFDAALIQKLNHIFREIDRNNAEWSQYAQQHNNRISELDHNKQQCTKPVTTETKESIIKCPLCGSLFDTVQAVAVHIDNDHNEASPTKAQTQAVETPILRPRRKRNKQLLLLSAESPQTTIKESNKNIKRQLMNLSQNSTNSNTNTADTPIIPMRRKSKKRRISEIAEDNTNNATTHRNICHDAASRIRAADFAQVEAMHSDHGDISSGHENEEEHHNYYDLDDSFINNDTQSPLITQQRIAYRKAVKTPKSVLRRLYGKDFKHHLSQLQKLESSVCDQSHITMDEEYEWNEMEGFEDPNDPILPAWDPHKEGMNDYDKEEESSSDDDELNIRERMKRAYLDQTQTQTRSRKRDAMSALHTSCSQPPKRRKLIQKQCKESPFFSQASMTNISDDNMFDDVCVAQTSVMMNNDESDEIPHIYMNLQNITWENLVTRPCDTVDNKPMNIMAADEILTPEFTPSTYNDRQEPASNMTNHIRIIMDATENQKAAKVNELLRNKYKITPKIQSLDFVQYIIGDSVAVIRKKEKDLVKGEQIMALKRILHRSTDRYKEIIFILHRMKETTKHRRMCIGFMKKLDRNLQQIALSPRITLIECVESEQVAETIVYCVKSAAKTNKNNVFGVPLCDELENDKNGINEQKLMFLRTLPQIGYSEAVWLLKEFKFKIGQIINCSAEKLANKVPSLSWNDRHKFIKVLMTHNWQKTTAQKDEEEFDKYMEESSAVKLRKVMKRTKP